jgi:hypothetical protein
MERLKRLLDAGRTEELVGLQVETVARSGSADGLLVSRTEPAAGS